MKSSDGPARSMVSPCLLVQSIEAELEFLEAVFRVTVNEGTKHESAFWQLEAKLGDTTLKIGHAHVGQSPTSSVLYVWTDEVDATYERAMRAGATLISEPTDQPWGVREAGFRGPQGDIWWIGKRKRKMSSREVEQSLTQQRKSRL